MTNATREYVVLTPILGLTKQGKPLRADSLVQLDDETAEPLLTCGALRLADSELNTPPLESGEAGGAEARDSAPSAKPKAKADKGAE